MRFKLRIRPEPSLGGLGFWEGKISGSQWTNLCALMDRIPGLQAIFYEVSKNPGKLSRLRRGETISVLLDGGRL